MTSTDSYEGLIAETVAVRGDGGDMIHAYLARPTGPGPFPAMVLFHHMPGWDDWYRRTTQLFALRGYVAISPDLFCRAGHGEPDDVAARVKADGGVADDQVVGDAAGSVEFLRAQPYTTGKVGYFGTCSGGRHAYLAACRGPQVDALVNCWGGGVVAPADSLTDNQPVAPIDYTADLSAPMLSLSGNDDKRPSPADIDTLEETLEGNGKTGEFHRYDGAGHGFFYDFRPSVYRPEQTADGWEKIWDFLGRTLR